jgi:hypothetical protein
MFSQLSRTMEQRSACLLTDQFPGASALGASVVPMTHARTDRTPDLSFCEGDHGQR